MLIRETGKHTFMQGGDEMGALMRSCDWTNSLLGNPGTWPLELKNTIRFILDTPFPMYISWGTDLIQFYNDGFRPILGTTKHPYALGHSTRETFGEIWETIGPLFDKVWGGEPVRIRDLKLVLNRHGYDEDVYFDFSYSPIRLSDGTIGGIFVTVLETTDKMRDLLDLEETAKAYINVLAQAPVAMCVMRGTEHVIEIASNEMIELWGKTGSAVLGNPVFEVVPEARNQGLEELLDSVYTTGKRVDAFERPVNLMRETAGEGQRLETVYQNFSYEAVRNTSGQIIGVIAVTQNVTEQVEARHRLEVAEERLRLALEATEMGSFDHDILTKHTVTSKRLLEIFDVEVTTNQEEIIKHIIQEDRFIRIKAMEEAVNTGRLFYEVRIQRNSGEIRWIRAEGRTYFDNEQRPLRIVGMVQDITEKKEMEQKREEYIAIASHELRNPLTSLKLSLDILNERANGTLDQSLFQKSQRHLARIMNMTDDLLNVSKISSGNLDIKLEIFNLQECIAESVTTFLGRHKNPVTVSGDDQQNIRGDKFRIEQVLVNLLSNASKYSPEDSAISLTVTDKKDHILIEVTDQGIGIESDKIPHLFKKFARLKSAEHIQGYGLGLYISDQIVRNHGGKIGVTSERGKGSSFWFTLPR